MIGTALLIALVYANAPASAIVSDTYKVSVESGFFPAFEQSIMISRAKDADGKYFWVFERMATTTRRFVPPVEVTRHDWIDGRKCPKSEGVVSKIPATFTEHLSREPPPFHGVNVSILRRLEGGAEARKTDYEGPAAKWWRLANAELSDCWSTEAVVIGGAALPPRLDTTKVKQDFTPKTGWGSSPLPEAGSNRGAPPASAKGG
ncbi:hypothetical protein [Caulobacter segnis]